MKLTKEDYIRLPKERLAELLAEMDNSPVEPIIIPSQPSTTPSPYPSVYYTTYCITDDKGTEEYSAMDKLNNI